MGSPIFGNSHMGRVFQLLLFRRYSLLSGFLILGSDSPTPQLVWIVIECLSSLAPFSHDWQNRALETLFHLVMSTDLDPPSRNKNHKHQKMEALTAQGLINQWVYTSGIVCFVPCNNPQSRSHENFRFRQTLCLSLSHNKGR